MSQLYQAILNIQATSTHDYHTKIKQVLGETDAQPLISVMCYYHGQDTMLMGPKHHPETSKKLVELGIFHVDGDYVKVDPAIYQKHLGLEAKFEAQLREIQEKAKLLGE